ncbi:MAG: hypothetical protein NZ900_06705 [Synergistetes bacterium]|nr:hypothetical protein [Synergistota bacterium]MDW8192615.1 hypothetical protein [Synergistota bacterium]
MLEDVSFYPHVDNAIRVFREGVEVWKGVPARWEAWKLVIADVDGDGIKELLVGVNIKTRFFPNKHRSIFVLGWNGSFAYPRWLGSHMSKPLIDFTAFNLDGLPQDELITLEETREGRRCLLVYRWVGFGFIVIWHSEPFNGGELFNDGSVVGVKFQDGGFRIVRFFNGGFLLRPYP